jgi:hypothetical protein
LILVSQKTLFEFCANPELVGKLNTVCLESLPKQDFHFSGKKTCQTKIHAIYSTHESDNYSNECMNGPLVDPLKEFSPSPLKDANPGNIFH